MQRTISRRQCGRTPTVCSWIHEHLANGPTRTRYIDDKVIVLNRTGRPGLLTAINFDTWNTRSIRCPTSFGANIQLHDYTGRHADIWTDSDGFASFRIPSNAFSSGQSYLCFSLAGVNFAAGITGRPTTRTIFGSNDLDAPPAKNSQVTVVEFRWKKAARSPCGSASIGMGGGRPLR
jgi:alpha-amylase